MYQIVHGGGWGGLPRSWSFKDYTWCLVVNHLPGPFSDETLFYEVSMIIICNDQTYHVSLVPHIKLSVQTSTYKSLSLSQLITVSRLLLGSTIVVVQSSIYFHTRSVLRNNFRHGGHNKSSQDRNEDTGWTLTYFPRTRSHFPLLAFLRPLYLLPGPGSFRIHLISLLLAQGWIHQISQSVSSYDIQFYLVSLLYINKLKIVYP